MPNILIQKFCRRNVRKFHLSENHQYKSFDSFRSDLNQEKKLIVA